VIAVRLRGWRPSRIGLRLLAFNLLVVFVPIVAILYLDVYESHLRQAQENAMVQQARLLAAGIADGSGASLDAAQIERTFARLERRSDVRFRVYDPSGALVADSARATLRSVDGSSAGSPEGPSSVDAGRSAADSNDARTRLLYRAGAWVVNTTGDFADTVRAWVRPGLRKAAVPEAEVVQAEVRAALDGRYGAATRVTPGQRSLTMFSAVPVRRNETVIGAVVASQSTFRILRALYDVRLHVFEIVLASLVAAAGLTALAATTIVRPLTRLRRQASALADRRGPSPESFPGSGRKDELGDLARALEELTRRTNGHIALLHAFSADVSHELKNPIASIRTAGEMMACAASEEERHRFLRLMMRDVARLERLVSSLRDIAVVERQIETDAIELVDVGDVLREVGEAAQRHAGTRISIDLSDAGVGRVRASRERLAQVFDNLVANAVSFAPDGTAVDVRAGSSTGAAVVTVEDRGPGIPDSHLDRVFARYFTYRPAEGRGDHVGLGLAIARQIVESYGGSIVASNRDGGGARFTVRFPPA